MKNNKNKYYFDMAKNFLDSMGLVDAIYIKEDNDYEHSGSYSNFSIRTGATKIVLIPNDSKKEYVIKIPFTGEGCFTSETDCEGCKQNHGACDYECGDYEQEEYNEANFEGASDALRELEGSEDINYWDYCKTEEIIYNRALRNKAEKFFLESKNIGEHNGIPIYIQKRATTVGVGNTISPSEDSINFSKKHVSRAYDIFPILEEYYGKESCLPLFDFLGGLNVNDLHNGNVGLLDNKPVLFDYSGFHN